LRGSLHSARIKRPISFLGQEESVVSGGETLRGVEAKAAALLAGLGRVAVTLWKERTRKTMECYRFFPRFGIASLFDRMVPHVLFL